MYIPCMQKSASSMIGTPRASTQRRCQSNAATRYSLPYAMRGR